MVYISKNIGKLPDAIPEFLEFFVALKGFYASTNIFNRVCSDIVELFPKLKVGNICNILESLAQLKYHHKQIISMIFKDF